jgi:hypothetical protein
MLGCDEFLTRAVHKCFRAGLAGKGEALKYSDSYRNGITFIFSLRRLIRKATFQHKLSEKKDSSSVI